MAKRDRNKIKPLEWKASPAGPWRTVARCVEGEFILTDWEARANFHGHEFGGSFPRYTLQRGGRGVQSTGNSKEELISYANEIYRDEVLALFEPE